MCQVCWREFPSETSYYLHYGYIKHTSDCMYRRTCAQLALSNWVTLFLKKEEEEEENLFSRITPKFDIKKLFLWPLGALVPENQRLIMFKIVANEQQRLHTEKTKFDFERLASSLF